jgi:hypothetical protein
MQAGFELFGGGVGLASSGYSAKINVAESEPKYGQIATGVNSDARMAVFNIGRTNLATNYSYQTSAGPTGPWTANGAFGAGAGKRLATGMALDSTNHALIDVFVIGTDDHIYHNRQTAANGGWSGWQGLGGSTAKEIGVVRNDDNKMEIVYIGTNGGLYDNREQINGAWTGETTIEAGAGAKHMSLTTNYFSDTPVVVYTDANNNLRQNRRNDYAWVGSHSIGGQAVQLFLTQNILDYPDPDEGPLGSLELVYVGTDTNLYYKGTTSGMVDATWFNDTAMGSNAKQVVLQQRYDNKLQVFYVGMDGKVKTRAQNTGTASSGWSAETVLVNSTDPATQIATTHNSVWGLEVFYTSPSDGAIYRLSQAQPFGTWSGPTSFNASAASP